LKTNPVTYKIEDNDKEKVSESFYEPELVLYNKIDEIYEIEKILKEIFVICKYFVKIFCNIGYPIRL
jgi:hypothetical protein